MSSARGRKRRRRPNKDQANRDSGFFDKFLVQLERRSVLLRLRAIAQPQKKIDRRYFRTSQLPNGPTTQIPHLDYAFSCIFLDVSISLQRQSNCAVYPGVREVRSRTGVRIAGSRRHYLDDRLWAREDFRGLPPSLPFARDEAAFLFDFTEPRHAGQNDTKSILWIGHFGIPLPPDTTKSLFTVYRARIGQLNGGNLVSAGCLPAAYNDLGSVLWNIKQMSP